MVTFTRRGGLLVFAGSSLIAIGIAFAGYLSLINLAKIIIGSLFPEFNEQQNSEDFSFLYGSNIAEGANIPNLLTIWFLESFLRFITGKLVFVSNILVYNFLLLGTMLVLSVVTSYPFFVAGIDPKSIKITRVLSKNTIYAGEHLYVEVQVSNFSLSRIPLVEIYDSHPEIFDIVLGENYLVTQLSSKKSTVFGYFLYIPVRGSFLIGPTTVVIHDRQGFFVSEAILASLSEIVVYNSQDEIRKLQLLGDKRKVAKLFGVHQTKLKGGGLDFFGLKDYEPGDQFRLIHWASLAKTGGTKILVREFLAEQQINVLILLDSSASMGVGLQGNNKLEFCIRGAALLTHLSLEANDLVGLCVYDETVNVYLEPKKTRPTMLQILNALAYVQPHGRGKMIDVAEFILNKLTRASYLIILSDLESQKEEIIDAIRKLRSAKHRIYVISPFGPWFEAFTTKHSQADKLLGEAIQETFITERKNLFKILSNLEVEIISVGPNDFIANVIAQFSKMKSQVK